MNTSPPRFSPRLGRTGFSAWLLAALAWAIPSLCAAESYLRIETGRHSAMVNRLAINEKGDILATASDDKTVRLWTLPDGLPYATLRVPIGPSKKGQVYAVAISPDGKTVAAGGETGDVISTGGGERGDYSLYLFDVDKRVLKGRLKGLPSPIRHLAYSKDGQRLAAALSGGKGVRVWSTKDDELLGGDQKSYTERCTWLDFDRQGNLATVSADGKVRLYGPDLKLLKEARPRAKAEPYSIEFSSAGDRLAVGYFGLPEVDILSATDLKTLKSLKAQGLTGDNAGVVAWQSGAAGEEALLAGGNLRNGDGHYVIRSWRGLTTDKPVATDIAVAENTITDIAALGNERVDILFSSADPSWGAIKNASLAYKVKSSQWDARVAELAGNGIRLSVDGLTVDYPADANSGKRMVFDVRRMQLEEAAPTAQAKPPLTESKAYKLTQWRRSEKPSFNGKPLALEKGERSYGLAIDPATGNFLLGTEYYLRLYNKQGREIKRSEVLPAPAYSVNLSGNGRLAVAALGDGTLHWYGLDGGAGLEELAAVFPYDEGKRWLTWTREGFFGHSPRGGDDLAGYHIDKGDNRRPAWVAFDQLYQAYYAPELVTSKLLGDMAPLTERLAKIDLAPKRIDKLPLPGIELAELCPVDVGGTRGFVRVSDAAPPATGCQPLTGQGQTRGFVRKEQLSTLATYRNSLAQHHERVKLRYKITVREGGLGNIDVYVNGRLQESRRPPNPLPQDKVLSQESELTLADGDNQIVVQAYEQTGGASEKSTLVSLLNPPSSVEPSPSKPKLIVATVGINAYPNPNQLKNAAKDAADFMATVEQYKSDTYGRVVKFGVFDSEATGENIDRMFDKVKQAAEAQDTVLIYLSGHGLRDEMNYYFMPVNGNIDNLQATALSQQRMMENIAKLNKVGKVFLFLDSCYSGAFQLTDPDQAVSGQSALKRMLGENLFVLSASREDQEALDESGKGSQNGLFAYMVLKGLKGEAAPRSDNTVDNYNLGNYVQRQLGKLSDQQDFKQRAKFHQAASPEIKPFDITKVVY